MSLVTLNQDIELDQKRLCRKSLMHLFLWFAPVALIVVSIASYKEKVITLGGFDVEYLYVALVVIVPFFIGLTTRCFSYLTAKKQQADYREFFYKLERAVKDVDILRINKTIADTQEKAGKNSFIEMILEPYLPLLNNCVCKLRQKKLRAQLVAELQFFELNVYTELAAIKKETPLVKAKVSIEASLEFLKRRRKEILTQWQQSYEGFSWWNKIKYAGVTPDFSEMDKVVEELERMDRQLESEHNADFSRLDAHFETLKIRAVNRVSKAKATAECFIQDCGHQEGFGSDLLKKSVWLSAFSLPISVWTDADSAGDVFDALRSVNGNYSEMSDSEIWWETLFLPAESLAGLAALTKGAYFEQLVVADTGGELFEHFNNPNTDIVIDGIAFQLKATDSVSYVYSVAEGIPVIATSEVALTTGVIDSGYSNEELTDTVDLALGDTVVDAGDSVVDAILTGVGGIGFFATLEGINHAATKHQNGGDGVEAMFEGAGVAVEGTARALVGAAELGYKVLATRPSRFIGRILLRGFKRLDDKLMEESNKT